MDIINSIVFLIFISTSRERKIASKNKILIELEIPLIEKSYDLYIPINKRIGTIKQLIENKFQVYDAKKQEKKALLSHEETLDLINKVQKEDSEEAKEILIENNLGLVRSVVSKFFIGFHLDF